MVTINGRIHSNVRLVINDINFSINDPSSDLRLNSLEMNNSNFYAGSSINIYATSLKSDVNSLRSPLILSIEADYLNIVSDMITTTILSEDSMYFEGFNCSKHENKCDDFTTKPIKVRKAKIDFLGSYTRLAVSPEATMLPSFGTYEIEIHRTDQCNLLIKKSFDQLSNPNSLLIIAHSAFFRVEHESKKLPLFKSDFPIDFRKEGNDNTVLIATVCGSVCGVIIIIIFVVVIIKCRKKKEQSSSFKNDEVEI